MDQIARLELLGAVRPTAVELAAYCDRHFVPTSSAAPPTFPLLVEPHVSAWQSYSVEADQIGAFLALKNRLVQLRFPILAGISDSENYRAATRRGVSTDGMAEATGLVLENSRRLQLVLHESLAGPIPVLMAAGRADFISLLQALTKHNEPVPFPDSLGAMIVSGYNNWDRVQQLKDRWQAAHADVIFGEGWACEFQTNVVPNKDLYQDRFILLSDGPYSGIAATELGLADDDWRRISVTIRLEHESTHYFTRRVFGSMQNHVLDELIADYRGLVAATGRFRADWFLRFMGLENYPDYRPSGRLSYYRGNPPLSNEAFGVLQKVVKLAAERLQNFDNEHAGRLVSPELQLRVLMALCEMTLDQLASNDFSDRLRRVIDGSRGT